MKKIIFILGIALLFGGNLCKAQMNTRMITYYDPGFGGAYYLTWDTKTGKSLQYFWNWDSKEWDTMLFNIPNPPLKGTIEGKVMFDVYYDTIMKKAFYTIWDTKTGRNTQYYWDEGKWTEMKFNMPEVPLEGAKGDIMMSTYYSETEKKAFYLVYDTEGGKSVQYFWDNDHWTDMLKNLPAVPLH